MRCSECWPNFVMYMVRKMSEEMRYIHDEGMPVSELQFNGKKMEYCPFCGLKLIGTFQLINSHPTTLADGSEV